MSESHTICTAIKEICQRNGEDKDEEGDNNVCIPVEVLLQRLVLERIVFNLLYGRLGHLAREGVSVSVISRGMRWLSAFGIDKMREG